MSLTSTKLAELRKKIKEVAEQEQAAITSFPLTQLVRLYAKNKENFYKNYMHEFKLIASWLRPLSLPEYVPTQAEINTSNILRSYTTHEMARIVSACMGMTGLEPTRLIEYYIINELVMVYREANSNDH